jgi:ribosome biogenesis GTPase
MTGVIVKGIGGFYYVQTDEGLFESLARGIFRKDNIVPAVGDRVRIGLSPDGQATIDEILPRRNLFTRPPVANVETMVIVAAARDPAPNFYILDLFAVTAEQAGADVLICINKMDLDDGSVRREVEAMYGQIYPTHFTSGRTGEGLEALEQALGGTQAALAGPSGAGKSTLLNAMIEHAESKTGPVSRRSARGRHTTRHTELYTDGTLSLFDTPGFTSFQLDEMDASELAGYFPEMEKLAGSCRFNDCRHLAEPDCSVVEAVERGAIHESRYRSYRDMMDAIESREKY